MLFLHYYKELYHILGNKSNKIAENFFSKQRNTYGSEYLCCAGAYYHGFCVCSVSHIAFKMPPEDTVLRGIALLGFVSLSIKALKNHYHSSNANQYAAY